METAKRSSTALDWVLFLVSTAAMIYLLMYLDEFFWVALPFSLTYLAKAMRVI